MWCSRQKQHNKSDKLFGYLKCDIRNIDFRNPKHSVFLTYKTYSKVSFDILKSYFWNPKQLSDVSFGYLKGCLDMLWRLALRVTLSCLGRVSNQDSCTHFVVISCLPHLVTKMYSSFHVSFSFSSCTCQDNTRDKYYRRLWIWLWPIMGVCIVSMNL